jgi:hypothetical protein
MASKSPVSKKQEQKSLTPAQNTALDIPKDLTQAFEEEQGAGFEGADRESYLIPFLVMLQKGSPQCDSDSPSFVKGAVPGTFFNTATGQIYPDGITVVPAYYERKMVEWCPRAKGGGFRGAHLPEDINLSLLERDENGRFTTKEGNHIMDTRYHFCVLRTNEGGVESVVIAFASTQIKKSRGWMTIMSQLRLPSPSDPTKLFAPPTYCRRYTLTSVAESNEKGTWRGVVVTPGPFLNAEDRDLYMAAKELRKELVGGKRKAADPLSPQDLDGAEY